MMNFRFNPHVPRYASFSSFPFLQVLGSVALVVPVVWTATALQIEPMHVRHRQDLSDLSSVIITEIDPSVEGCL
jgi:hypothetical protein